MLWMFLWIQNKRAVNFTALTDLLLPLKSGTLLDKIPY